MKIRTLWFLLLLGYATSSPGQEPAGSPERRLVRNIAEAKSDSQKIAGMAELGFFFYNVIGDNRKADSISEQALLIAEASHRPELLLMACNKYVVSNDLHQYFDKALQYALKAEQLAEVTNSAEMTYQASRNLVSIYLAGYRYDKALEYSYKSLSIATTNDNQQQKAESYLNIGKSLEGKNQKIEAFRNYINAANIAEKMKKPAILTDTYNALSAFYNFNKIYNKATRYKLMNRDLILRQNPVDSTALMWTEYDLQVIDVTSGNNMVNETNVFRVLNFAKRHGLRRLMNYEIALYRTHLIEANRISELKDFYTSKLPEEWAALPAENPGLSFRLKAVFCEEEKKQDSALLYFEKAKALLASDPNMILQSKFFNRYGRFLARHGFREKAEESFKTSYNLAEKASYLEYMLLASENLESIYASAGDFRQAYNYSSLNKVLTDSISNLSKKDQILVMEIDQETRRREMNAEQEKEETHRRHNLQYMAMIIAIFTVFVILIMLGSMKVPEWIIRMLGFFSFIFLFEFVTLLADHEIHELTSGEPWKIMLIKIFLIAILLPLHHKIEKIVITYLLNHQLLNMTHFSLLTNIRARWRKKKMEEEEQG